MNDPKPNDPLADAKRIMGNLARTPHKPHVAGTKKAKSKRRRGSKARLAK